MDINNNFLSTDLFDQLFTHQKLEDESDGRIYPVELSTSTTYRVTNAILLPTVEEKKHGDWALTLDTAEGPKILYSTTTVDKTIKNIFDGNFNFTTHLYFLRYRGKVEQKHRYYHNLQLLRLAKETMEKLNSAAAAVVNNYTTPSTTPSTIQQPIPSTSTTPTTAATVKTGSSLLKRMAALGKRVGDSSGEEAATVVVNHGKKPK